uniref:ArfGAP with SH3 domain, ankyrin repeat and PH domain 1b n=1 Tax=Xiphophorus couchianus TaxID=32473 RepID=A0A3B5LWE1_9TELE
MPDQISVTEFLSETTEDYNSPTTSSFTTRMQSCRNTVNVLEEVRKDGKKMNIKVSYQIVSIYLTGKGHNEETYAQALDKFGSNFISRDNPDLGTAFVKFSSLTKELSTLLKNLLQSLSHNVIFTLDSLLKGDLKGVKGDLKKPFDKAWKDYEAKFTKIEKEKREHAKQHGMIRTEITGAEIAEEMEKERRLFQLQMCEYLIKVNEIKTKKGVDLLQNLIKYYHAQCNFFQDGLKTADKLKQYIEKLAADLYNIKQTQDEEKKQLTALRDLIKSSLQLDQKEDSQSKQGGYSMHQLQGNKEFGSEKKGYLLKKSDGLRKVWQRRQCSVKGGILTISHATVSTHTHPNADVAMETAPLPAPPPIGAPPPAACCAACGSVVFDGPLQETGETALHYAVRTADQTSLHLVDFLVQNSGNLDKQTEWGNTALHYCCMYEKPECLKLLLRGKPATDIANQNGETALDVARRLRNTQCEEALVQAAEGKFNPHIHVEYEWSLRLEEMDESDDDLDDKPSPIKKDRSPRPQSFCHSSSLSPHDKLSLPGFISQRDKQQRLSYSAFTNQMYSASTDLSSSPVADGPPLPPRNQGKGQTSPPPSGPPSTLTPGGSSTLSKKRPPPPPPGHKRTLSDPPSPLSHSPHSKGGAVTGGETAKHTKNSSYTTSSNTKSTLGPRVLPKLPQKVALRKIDTIHHPSVDKSSLPPEVFQKSPPPTETAHKAPLADRPQLGDLPPKPQVSELPPKPGELPPKPQLSDLPPKPQLGDLPPKPQLKDLPPKPHLADLHPKPGTSESAPRPHQQDSPSPNQQVANIATPSQQTTEDTNGTPPGTAETPVPLPRKINTGKNKTRRVKTIYDCQADNDDELTFVEGEVIIVTGEEDQEWWIGHIEGDPDRKGVFPMSFVHILSD